MKRSKRLKMLFTRLLLAIVCGFLYISVNCQDIYTAEINGKKYDIIDIQSSELIVKRILYLDSLNKAYANIGLIVDSILIKNQELDSLGIAQDSVIVQYIARNNRLRDQNQKVAKKSKRKDGIIEFWMSSTIISVLLNLILILL